MGGANHCRVDPGFPMVVLLLLLLVAGGSHAQTTVSGASVDSGGSLAGDTALFATIIRSLPRAEYHDLMLDPRIIKDDPDIVWVHPGSDFLETDGANVDARAAVIRRLHAGRLSGPDYFACDRGPGGLIKADSAGLALLRRGPRRPLCITQGVPRPGGPYFPPGGVDRRGSAPAGAYTVRTVTIDPGKYTVYDVVCVRRGAGWEVVEKAVLFEGWS